MFKADQLKKEGFMVLGGSELAHMMEKDREFGAEIAKKAGVNPPPTYEFSDIQSGLDLLESNPETAYVFKPDEPDDKAWTTTIPDSERNDKANRELYEFLRVMPEGKGDYILQERKSGIEINIEIFVYQGKAFFAHANYECKKKSNRDLGEFGGCAFDIEFVVPVDCKLVQDTVGNLLKLPEFKNYIGILDMNLICGDNQYWFLEFCARFGYNALPNLIFNLGISPFGEIMSDFLTGNVKDFYKHFRVGYGASITLRKETRVSGLPILIDETIDHKFYHFDTYKENEMYYLSGYGEEVGIVMGMDYDIKSASEEALKNLDKISFPGKSARTDIDQTNFLNNPLERNIASEAMKLFDKI